MKTIIRRLVKSLPQNQTLYLVLKAFGIPHRISKHLHIKGNYWVPLQGKKIQLFSTGTITDNRLFWRGLKGSETTTLRLWEYFSKESNVIFDVGANLGLFSLTAKSINPSAEVHGFEPVPKTFEIFQRNAKLNSPEVICHELAISDYNGTGQFSLAPGKEVWASFEAGGRRSVQIEVGVKMLDSIVQENDIQRVDLLKIDVEGFEPYVLRGLEKTLNKDKPTLIIEVLNNEVGEENQRILASHGYVIFYIDEEKGLIPSEKMHRLSRSRNYLACTPSKFEALNQRLPKIFASTPL